MGRQMKRIPMRHPSEDVEQARLIDWCRMYRLPDGRRLSATIFAIPNGGKRNPREAAKLKRTGVRPGVSDLFLPVPRNGFAGLFIEMKKIGGKESATQRDFRTQMDFNGYSAKVCYGWADAASTICEYLGKPEWVPL